MNDTSRDPRLLVAEHALNVIKANIFMKGAYRSALSKEQINSRLTTAESSLMSLKYKYETPAAISDTKEVEVLSQTARELRNSMAGIFHLKGAETMVEARLYWAFRTWWGLSERLKRAKSTEDVLAHGVDMIAVTVRNVHPKDKFWQTTVIEGEREFSVMTNIEGIDAGARLGIAILPPAQIAGQISQAMFLGKVPRNEKEGTHLELSDEEIKEVSSILIHEMGIRK